MENNPIQPNTNNSLLNNNPLITIVFVVLITAILTGAIVYIVLKNSFDKEKEELEQRIEELEQKTGEEPLACTQEVKLCPDGSSVSRTGHNCEFTPCPEEDPYKDWQTYRNEEYKYEIKCPNDVGYLSPEGGVFLGPLSDETAKQTNMLILGKKSDELVILFIDAGHGNENGRIRELEELDAKGRFDVNDININGLNFKEYSLKTGVYNGYNEAYLFRDGNRFILIRFIATPMANQIISTFKFIE